MGLQHAEPLIERHNYEIVARETWGHLAPIKNKIYKGRIVYAIGCFDSGDLNPTPLICDFDGLDSSPWFYENLHKWLSDLPSDFRQDGCVYEWSGTFRNYVFSGKLCLVFDPNPQR